LTVAAPAAGSALAARFVTAAVGIPVVLGATLAGGLFFLAFVALLVLLGTLEFHRLAAQKGVRAHRIVGTAAALAVAAAAFARGEPAAAAVLVAALVASLVASLARGNSAGAMASVAATFLGVAYVGWFGAHFLLLRDGREIAAGEGSRVLLLVILTTWICDTAAYFVGITIGRHRLLPHASPKKSVEGGVAGLVAAVAAAVLLRGALAPALAPAFAVAVGLVVGVIGQAGDFAESLLKRDAGVKDSAAWLPGHGGVLDRFDSLLVSVPVVYYLLRFAP